ncbi:hypothetical protein N234_16350 [Ralstonia pickettii DTP0602]|nr:hypothetical protein N234_16350 [Ralstonia pickettii DTP0602]
MTIARGHVPLRRQVCFIVPFPGEVNGIDAAARLGQAQ